MALYGALAEAERTGKEVLAGRVEVTASVTVSTPFAEIDTVGVTRETDTAPGVTATTYTFEVDGSDVKIYAWKPTSSSDPTLIAADAASDIAYFVVGRRAR